MVEELINALEIAREHLAIYGHSNKCKINYTLRPQDCDCGCDDLVADLDVLLEAAQEGKDNVE